MRLFAAKPNHQADGSALLFVCGHSLPQSCPATGKCFFVARGHDTALSWLEYP
jgi:hypothetical protein